MDSMYFFFYLLFYFLRLHNLYHGNVRTYYQKQNKTKRINPLVHYKL